ncbi:MAG: O-antigen ligase family protein [Patescibacteria group bacterium]
MRKLLRLSDELLKYLVAAIILAVPLFPKFPFVRIAGTYVSIRLEDFLIATLGLLVFIKLLPELKNLFERKIERSIVIFLAVGLVSLISAIFLTKTVLPSIGILHLLRRIEYLIPFFAGLAVMRSKNVSTLDFFLKLFLIVVSVAFIYGWGQKYYSWPVIITQNEEYSKGVALRWTPGSHINSSFAGHYDLATFLVMVLPVFISLAAVLKSLKTRIVLIVVTFLGLWLLSNAISRISIVSYLLAVTAALTLIKKYKLIPVVLILSLIFFGLSVDLWARYGRIIEVAKTKLLLLAPRSEVLALEEPQTVKRTRPTPTPTPPPVFEDRSTSIRLNVEWPRAIRAFSKNPLLGTGYSSITLATDNDYLRLLGEVGILGFSAFLLIITRIGQLILKSLPLERIAGGVELGFLGGFLGSLSGIFLNAAFIDVFEASKFATIFWLLAGFAVSLMRKPNYE